MTQENLKKTLLNPFFYVGMRIKQATRNVDDLSEDLGRIISVDVNLDNIELPIFMHGRVIYTLFNSSVQAGQDIRAEFYIPTNGTVSTMRRTASTILTDLFQTRIDDIYRLATAKSNKNITYYGMPGLILDEDYKPLLITTISSKIPPAEEMDRDYPHCIITGVNIIISKRVFERQTDLVCKAIIKEVLPLYFEIKDEIISKLIRQSEGYSAVSRNCEVNYFIKELDNWFVKIPTPETLDITEMVNYDMARIFDAESVRRDFTINPPSIPEEPQVVESDL